MIHEDDVDKTKTKILNKYIKSQSTRI